MQWIGGRAGWRLESPISHPSLLYTSAGTSLPTSRTADRPGLPFLPFLILFLPGLSCRPALVRIPRIPLIQRVVLQGFGLMLPQLVGLLNLSPVSIFFFWDPMEVSPSLSPDCCCQV